MFCPYHAVLFVLNEHAESNSVVSNHSSNWMKATDLGAASRPLSDGEIDAMLWKQMRDEGLIEFSNGKGFRITDAGRAALEPC